MRRTLRKTMMCQCGWVVTRVQLETARFDYGCPNCHAPYSEFKSTTLCGEDYELEVVDENKQPE